MAVGQSLTGQYIRTSCLLQDLRQLRTKPGQPLSALPGLNSGIMFCTYDLLCSGATPAKKKGKGVAAKGKGVKAAAAAAAGGFSSYGLGAQRSGNASLWDDENVPPWDRPLSPEEDEEEPIFDEFGEQRFQCASGRLAAALCCSFAWSHASVLILPLAAPPPPLSPPPPRPLSILLFLSLPVCHTLEHGPYT